MLLGAVLATVSNAGLVAASEGDSMPLSLYARDTPGPAPTAPSGEGSTASSEPTLDEAIEAGDWGTARDLAVKQRVADPSAKNFGVEGRVLEAAGDYDGAAAAYRQQLDALEPQANAEREAAERSLARVGAAARGTQPGEPASSHREALDERWAPKPPPRKRAKPVVKAPVVADEAPRERVVDKWYFWVTIGAIVASAGAVTGIAIRASRTKQPDALGRMRAPTPSGPAMLRF